MFKIGFHTFGTYTMSFNEFQKRLNQLFGAKLTMKKNVDYFDNYFKIISGFFTLYLYYFKTRGANFYAGNSALHRCIPWLHNF
jgi:hypothetical protein